MHAYYKGGYIILNTRNRKAKFTTSMVNSIYSIYEVKQILQKNKMNSLGENNVQADMKLFPNWFPMRSS